MNLKLFVVVFVTLGTISAAHARSVFLAFSARNLPSMDIANGAPDAYVIVFYRVSESSPYENRGETDNISDNRNPDWPEVFEIFDNGNPNQRMKFEMWDSDSPDPDDYMGFVELFLQEITEDADGVVTKNLTHGQPGGGQLIIKRQL